MLRMKKQLGALVLVAGLCAPAVWGQQNDPQASAPTQPITPANTSSKESSESGDTSGAAPAGMVADARPLTGAEQYTLGSEPGQRSFFLASIHFREIADSNSTSTPGGSEFNSASLLSGEALLKRQIENGA